MNICPVCGTEHQTSGCPGGSPVFADAPAPATVTLNGLTFGEQEILNKLECIIIELQNLCAIVRDSRMV